MLVELYSFSKNRKNEMNEIYKNTMIKEITDILTVALDKCFRANHIR